jgi:AbrB family looped-hinge helix DNA binding protein
VETTRLSSKGHVIIPKAVRSAHRWEAGLDFLVIDTGDGILLKPKAPFEATVLADVAGMFKAKVNSGHPGFDGPVRRRSGQSG